uniref:Inter-alpha-trypsin inhibitor heavy chain H3 n=1 Tax=Magallana gigas TaxID=29159 RepID=K1PXQ1_MAGGI
MIHVMRSIVGINLARHRMYQYERNNDRKDWDSNPSPLTGFDTKTRPTDIVYLGLGNQKPSIYYLHVTSDIRFRFATTLVTSKVANPANTSQEVKFDVTLPDEAYISDFKMEIGGRIYPGEINEKAAAQKQYDAAKKKGQSAGQVKQQPRKTNSFSVDVNVGAQEKVVFNLTYQELLKRKRGSYEHVIYIDPKQVVKDFQIGVSIEESRDITTVRVPPLRNDLEQAVNQTGQNSLAVIERPTKRSARVSFSPSEADQRLSSSQGISGLFVVEYDIDRKSDAGDVLVVDGYFVHFFAPSDMKEIPKDVLLILDCSGSMGGRKIGQMKAAVIGVLKDLHEGDRFNILKFSEIVEYYKDSMVYANKKSIDDAKEYVESLSPTGGTNINAGMLQGVDFLKTSGDINERSQVVFFLTDGEATSGITDNSRILENIRNANSKAFPVYSLAFGKGADYEFVKKVAVQNNGLSRRIYEDSDATLQIKGFYDEVSSAILKNVTFKYLNNASSVQNLTTVNFPSYFTGSEIVVAGKIENNAVRLFDLSVQGLGSTGSVELALSADVKSKPFPELTKSGDYEQITEKIWAYLTIKQLLEKSIGETDSTTKEELKNKALQLSLQYKFVTPLTSMVVTKPEEKSVGTLREGEDAERGGDPHFMIRIKGMTHPLCFDFPAKPGDVLRLLSDTKSGLFVNAGIIPSFEFDRHGKMKTFMGEIIILYKSHVMKITPSEIIYDGAHLFWQDNLPYDFDDVKVEIITVSGFRVMNVDFRNNVQIAIKKTNASRFHNSSVEYLNMYIENEAGLSKASDGILGQFLHRYISVYKQRSNKKDQIVGHLQIKEPGFDTTRMRAVLVKKPDEITAKREPCWNIHSKLKDVFDRNVQDFYIKDIMQT